MRGQLKQLHGSQQPADMHIVERNGEFKVFDKNQHFRCSFPTRQQAQDYIVARSARKPEMQAPLITES